MGGVAPSAYGATRPTTDFDCVVRRAAENLDRLAAALRELNARLRVDRLPDDEAAALPFRIDTQTLLHSEIWTLRTDAGDVDVLADIPDRQGHRRRYEDLIGAATTTQRSGQVLRLAARGRDHRLKGVGGPAQGPRSPPRLRRIVAEQSYPPLERRRQDLGPELGV